MSLSIATSPKHCAAKSIDTKKLRKKLYYFVSAGVLSVLSLAFLVWLILHPSKPQFYLKDTDVYQFSILPAPQHLLNSTVQFTLISKNPNSRVGIYYDQLRAYASYKGQQITDEAFIPPFYQGHEDTNMLSTSLNGNGMPVAPSIGYEVIRDQNAGKLLIKVKIDGRVRWKVATWVSGRYRLDVDCVSIVNLRPGGIISSTQGAECSTSV